jgi:hypothetical protein
MYLPDVLAATASLQTLPPSLLSPAKCELHSGGAVQGQSVQKPEQRQPTPVPSDDEDLDYEQARALRRFKKGKGRAGGLVTDLGKG